MNYNEMIKEFGFIKKTNSNVNLTEEIRRIKKKKMQYLCTLLSNR
jgi:hypothetical protein